MKISLLAATILAASFISPLASSADDATLDEARIVAMSLPPKLLATLQAEIDKSGPAGAISVCKDMAPKVAGEISQQTGWKIKRVSLKTRNEARATPDSMGKGCPRRF